MRRSLSAVLSAALITGGLTALTTLVASPAQAAMGARLYLHGTSSTYAQDALLDPTANEGYAPSGVTADTKPPTGTTSKTGLTLEPGGDPGLAIAPTFALGLTGSMKAACVDVFVEGLEAGATFPVYISFGSGPPELGGSWVYPDPVSAPGGAISRVTTLITLAAAFTLPEDATVFFHLNAFEPGPDQRPYILYYDSVEHPSNVTINPTGPCTPATGGGAAPPAPTSSAAASAEPSAEPSESAAASAEPSAEPSAQTSEAPSSSCASASASPSTEASAAEASASAAVAGKLPPAPPSPSASASASEEPSADPSASGSASADPSGPCDPATISLATSARSVTAGNAPTLSGVVRNARGDAIHGATVTIHVKGYGEAAYTAAATVVTDQAGQWRLRVRPMKQSAFVASAGSKRTTSVNIRVSTRVEIGRPAPSTTVSNPVTFTGRLTPGYARVPVGLGYLSNGRFRVLTQAPTNGSGGYSITARLPRGTYAFVVFTSAHQGTDKGSRSVRLTVR